MNELAPVVVAIHCQEIGGKDWETTMPKVPEFIRYGLVDCRLLCHRTCSVCMTLFKAGMMIGAH